MEKSKKEIKVELNYKKSFYENISQIYEELKKLRKKKQNAELALKKVKKEKAKEEKKEIKENESDEEKRWFENFYWSFTSEGKLIIGGKNQEQNELIFAKYFEAKDLFFHADIIGGSVTILKKGKEASPQELLEASQFSACFSKAWKEGYSRISSYYVEKEGVKKTHLGKKAEKGSFFIVGERRWFKNLQLILRIGEPLENKKEYGSLIVVPSVSKIKLKKEVILKPGRLKKESVCKELAEYYKVKKEKISSMLPTGRFFIRKVK